MRSGETSRNLLDPRIALLAACWCGVALITAYAPVATAQQAATQRSFRRENAHADRLVFSSTGETQPEGTFYFGSYELVLVQAGYAVTDRLQASLTGTYLGSVHLFEAAAKANLLRTERLRIAAITTIAHLRSLDVQLLFARAGAAATWCMNAGCSSFINLDASLFLHDKADTLLPLWLAGGVNVELSGSVSALLEYGSLMTVLDDLPELRLPFFFVSYGLRFGGPSWAFDFTMVRSLDGAEQAGQSTAEQIGDLFGTPFLAFTYRWLDTSSSSRALRAAAAGPPSF